ncbi:MAG TPA: cobyrinate a,c-diamide synthase [Chloroflexota bacterium]|nr:cobyrinate a,c-diamide synthase [Chloroflexota bacterium]
MIRLVIAAPTSGVGKTTVTSGLGRALRRRGLRVQPFKAGPDYIDPGYHERATGRRSRNLDTWMIPPAALRELFERASSDADVVLIEGMMGLFDGRGSGDEGSTAHLAKLLDVPVVVIVDVAKTSRSAGAIALGCKQFDPAVRVVGYVLNGVGGDAHRSWASDAITGATGLPVFGALSHRDDLALPERHLGLIPTTEEQVGDQFFEKVADQIDRSFDLDALLEAGRGDPPKLSSESILFPKSSRPVTTRIGIAADEAFGFYYEDNLDLLRAWGAQLVSFSPLRDATVPPGVGALYLGGGFPELYAQTLAGNTSMLDSLRHAASDGLPIYAECGGMMYLSRGIVDFDGRRHDLVGLVPAWSAMTSHRLTLGYRELRARSSTPVMRQGEVGRGHEFHWSILDAPLSAEDAAYEVLQAPISREGYARGNLLASYCHLHFGSNPAMAPNFVEVARNWSTGAGRHGESSRWPG